MAKKLPTIWFGILKKILHLLNLPLMKYQCSKCPLFASTIKTFEHLENWSQSDINILLLQIFCCSYYQNDYEQLQKNEILQQEVINTILRQSDKTILLTQIKSLLRINSVCTENCSEKGSKIETQGHLRICQKQNTE